MKTTKENQFIYVVVFFFSFKKELYIYDFLSATNFYIQKLYIEFWQPMIELLPILDVLSGIRKYELVVLLDANYFKYK